VAPVLAGQYGPEGLEFPDGRPARNTPVLVRNLDGTPATLYTNKEKTAEADNPIDTDEFGNIWFFAVPGEYELVVNGNAIPILVPVHPNDSLAAGTNPVVDWFTGEGPPGVVLGAGPGDMYIDELTGKLYQLR
jgi:hypothetical protein